MSLIARFDCLEVPTNYIQIILILLIIVGMDGRRMYWEFGVPHRSLTTRLSDFQLWLQKHHKVPPNLNATSYPNLGLGLAGAGKSSIAPTSVVGPSGCQSRFTCSRLGLR